MNEWTISDWLVFLTMGPGFPLWFLFWLVVAIILMTLFDWLGIRK